MVLSLGPTFVASLRAVGTAITMAFAGFYLHRRGFVTSSGKKMLALLSQQVTIPAFLFAKIIFCPSGGGSESSSIQNDLTDMVDDEPGIICPSVADRIPDLWMLLIWPFYVVFCGLCTGYLAARVSNTPPVQTRSCLAACAFGNSTGLVITLLTVIHKQFGKSTELGRIDPTAFLSVYLLLYPVLQWGVGGWLLAPEENVKESTIGNVAPTYGKIEHKEAGNNGATEANPLLTNQKSSENTGNGCMHHPLHISHILNYEPVQSPAMAAAQQEFGGVRSRHLFMKNSKSGNQHLYTTASNGSFTPLSMMVRELSFTSLSHHLSLEELQLQPSTRLSDRNDSANGDITDLQTKNGQEVAGDDEPLTMDVVGEATAAADALMTDPTPSTIHEHVPLPNAHGLGNGTDGYNDLPKKLSKQQLHAVQETDVMQLTETLLRISGKVFQPPVIGALLGLFIASFPTLRGLLENIWGDDEKTAPLKWMFDGINSVGRAAVPVNMTILGINLSSTFQRKKSKKGGKRSDSGEKSNMLPNKTMLAIVIGKLLVMPFIGMVSTWFLHKYYIVFPDDIDATCYLVMMIVFITPTANNVMVMVELSGSSSKEGMARIIGWQYMASPVILSIVLSKVVELATCHFDELPAPSCSA